MTLKYIYILYTISLEAIGEGEEAMTKIGYVLNWLSSRYHMLTQLKLIQVHTLHTHFVYAYFAKIIVQTAKNRPKSVSSS